MKKTTYILLGLVGLIFVIELAIGIYLYAKRIPRDEYRAMHPELYTGVTVNSDDYYIDDSDTEDATPVQEGATVIDASEGGYSVVITSDYTYKDDAATYYTDTLIITSPEKNIRVIR